ncbi:hypothetical protein [Xanthomonas translucens]|uniref:hypothetical protein n=1 Tax=Xanthomonas campestris pv. translucens TaxID=343 RepID=UPI00071E8CA3|nr:hypothetical protein [Xanthomonas translucens]
MDYDAIIKAAAAAVPAPRQTVPGLVAHIDGDALAYHAAGPDEMPPGQCRHNVLARVRKVKRLTGAETAVMHLTCPSSHKGHRYLIAQTRAYQGQRKTGRRPRNWQAARDCMATYEGSEYRTRLWTDREADDGIAHLCDTAALAGTPAVVHADDKDLRQFAGRHLNWRTWQITDVPAGAYEVIGPDGLLYGHKWFWTQLVTGDTADFIPGLPGQGSKAAEKLLAGTKSNQDAYEAVSGLYKARLGAGWADYLVEQAGLLWMRTGAEGDVLDFLRLGVFGPGVWAAAITLARRVGTAAQALAELQR